MNELVKVGFVQSRIYSLRGKKVIMDRDLATLYGVETKALNRAVRRNQDHFPPDFMLRLTPREWADLKCHFGASSWGQVNIAIMRAFVRMREVLMENKELARRLEALERRLGECEKTFGEHAVVVRAEIRVVFEAIRRLMSPGQGPLPS